MNRTEEYIQSIRTLSGLQNAILRGIVVTKRTKTAEFFLVTDKAYTAEEFERARKISESFLPSGFSAGLDIVKRVPDASMLKKKIFEYIALKFPAASAFLVEENIEVEMLTSGAHFVVDIASGEQTLFSSGKILDDTSEYLSSVYCGTFYGTVRIVEKDAPDESILEEVPETEEEEDEVVIFALVGEGDDAVLNPIEDEQLLDEVFAEFCHQYEEFENSDDAMKLEQ